MTESDAAALRRLLDGVKSAAPREIQSFFYPAMRQFRLLARSEQLACAREFHLWAHQRETEDPLKACYADLLLALQQFMGEDFESSLPRLIDAHARFEALHDKDGTALCAMLIGGIYRTLGNFDLALKPLWEALGTLQESGRYPVFVAATANGMANISLEMHDYDGALAMFRLAYDESSAADDFYFEVYALHGLGKVYMHRKQFAEAGRVFRDALQLAETNGHALQTANSLTELAILHARLEDFAEAERLHAQALAVREQHEFLAGAVTSCVHLAALYSREGRFDDARAVLEKGLALAERMKVKLKASQVHAALAELYERTHDLGKSLLHYKRFHELRAEVEQEDAARKLRDAKLVFEAEQTRKENAVIRRQQAEIQAKNVELQEKIDELTLARINKKARALTFALFVVLFIFQNAIMGFALGLLASNNYFLSLLVKMGIILSFGPVNKAIETYLLRKVIRKKRLAPPLGVTATPGSE